MIFPEHFGKNHVILLQTVSEWRYIKLCAIVYVPLCTIKNV